MVKEYLSKKNLMLWSALLMIAGLDFCIAAFVCADNKIENLKVNESKTLYQIIHMNKDNELRIAMEIGPVSIFSLVE